MKRNRRGDVLLVRTYCACCHRPAQGWKFCNDCRENHGSEQAGKDENWDSLCPYARAESAAYAARIAAMPAPAKRTYNDAFMGLEP